MANFTKFERYQPLIDDWPAFQAALSRPLPTCIWTNTLRTTPGQLATFLAADAAANAGPVKPLAWQPGGFELPPDFRPGHHWTFLAGLFQVQEAVSMLPVLLLDPQPGERVLDLCAAPGNKTAQIGVKMANRGTVVANDVSYGRMRGARQTIERLGLINVTTTRCDGGNYPKAAGQFDRVLVDAPCSGEGTSRKNPAVIQMASPKRALQQSRIQKGLLRQAIRRCKPGGRIVYSTCTYAPEENELVVDAILGEYGADQLRLVPARIEGFNASEGVTAWQGQHLQPSLRLTMRVWPHQNDSGGFFIAVLEKVAPEISDRHQTEALGTPAAANQSGGDECAAASGEEERMNAAAPLVFGSPPVLKVVLAQATERFGLSPDIFAPYLHLQRNADRAYLVAGDHQPPDQPKPEATGMVFLKTGTRYPKLSTAAAMMFGLGATQNYLDVDPQQAHAYLRREDFQTSAAQSQLCTGFGYVLVRHQGYVLGVAMYHPHENENGSGGLVRSLFPKGWSPT